MNPLVAQRVCLAEPAGYRVSVAWMIGPWVARGCAGNSTGGPASVFAQTLRRVLGTASRKGLEPLAFSRGMGVRKIAASKTKALKTGLPKKQVSATGVEATGIEATGIEATGIEAIGIEAIGVEIFRTLTLFKALKTALKSGLKTAKRISKISVPANGCPTWIRTMTNRFRDCCATITQSGSQNRSGDRTRNFL